MVERWLICGLVKEMPPGMPGRPLGDSPDTGDGARAKLVAVIGVGGPMRVPGATTGCCMRCRGLGAGEYATLGCITGVAIA